MATTPRTRRAGARASRRSARGWRQLLAVAERYPDLKASEQFLALQQQLADTEDRIQVARRIYNANVRAYDTLVQTFPAPRRPDVRIHDAAVLRGRPDRPRRGPATGGLVRSDVDKYNTARALPRPRRRAPGPHRGPRRRRRGSAGGRAGAGPGVRHQPGHRAPGARPVAPGGPGHEPPGRGMVRRGRPGPPAARTGHHRGGRGRGGRRAPGPRDPRVRFRRRARRPSPTRCTSIATPRCCASSASTSPTTNRSRW